MRYRAILMFTRERAALPMRGATRYFMKYASAAAHAMPRRENTCVMLMSVRSVVDMMPLKMRYAEMFVIFKDTIRST